ncbi:alpha/beta hydrolase [Kiloniella laminariae]|uniref:Alpha/beta hydrolase n=1 Tax=Kiloniella laminariae TaxID=454162 RepID=A0ABT4LLZ4_9PROT|nr:alpha/beta fold hydrolase [Kiloniella laminariae]MCZ4282143.1 alpha/beta hydrolase [Kiloniella laminariae]
MRVLLVHGWGYGPEIWQRVIVRLGKAHDIICADLGFRGHTDIPTGHFDVAVGHSLGVPWLLSQAEISWDELVSINGFTRFCAGEGFPEGVPPRFVDRMMRKLPKACDSVLQDFYALCETSFETGGEFGEKQESRFMTTADGAPDVERLMWGLEFLRDQDLRSRIDPASTTVLASRSDLVVSEAMTQHLFPDLEINWCEEAGHLLPWQNPDLCSHHILKAGIKR